MNILKDTIDTSRRISHDLLPPTLEKFGLAVAVEELSDTLNQSQSAKVFFEAQGEDIESLPQLISLNLFRVLQELINNTLKYAEASHIRIRLFVSPEKVELSYQDDGKGFDMEDMENKKGLGMKNIDSRLQMIEGKHDIQTSLGKGFQINMEAPLSLNPLIEVRHD